MRASTIILVPDLIKSLRHHLNSWMRTSADASSTMEMVDPDTGEIISPQTAHAAADPAAYKNTHQLLQPSVVHYLAALLAPFYTAVHNWR
jgi:hypothetical protein